MRTKSFFFSFTFVLFSLPFFANSTTVKAMFTSNATITDVETSLSFFIPEEHSEVFVFVSDEHQKVFQKVKVYQRGNGKIYCDKSNLEPGTYIYAMSVDGIIVDSQKLTIK